MAKVMSLVAGMVAGADSIEDTDRLRHAGNAVGHVQQLDAVLRQMLIALAERTPLLLGAEEVVFVDLDSTRPRGYDYAKQGASVGRLKGKKTLHPLLVIASTPITRPVVVAVRMRAIAPTATIVVRADSKLCRNNWYLAAVRSWALDEHAAVERIGVTVDTDINDTTLAAAASEAPAPSTAEVRAWAQPTASTCPTGAGLDAKFTNPGAEHTPATDRLGGRS